MQTIKRKGGTKYREEIYINGRRISKIFSRKTDAKNWKKKMQLKKEKLESLGIQMDFTTTLAAFIYMHIKEKQEQQLSPSTIDNYSMYARKHILPLLGEYKVFEIRLEHGLRVREELVKKGLSAKTINDILSFLKGLFHDLVKKDMIIKSPFLNLDSLKEKPKALNFWSDSQIKRFLSRNRYSRYFLVYIIAIYTGLRKGEIAGLERISVNFRNNLIEIVNNTTRYGTHSPKSNRIRFVPMNLVLRQYLEMEFKAKDSNFVVSNEDGSALNLSHLYREFKKDIERAEVTQIRFHDLRHTFASQFMMNGGNIYDLQKILGHSSVDQTQKYAHLCPQYLSGTTEILNFGIEDLEEKVVSNPTDFPHIAVVNR